MAAAEGFMGVAVTLLAAILAAVAMVDMGGAAVVTGAAGTVVAGMDAVGMVVVGTGAGMVVVRIGMAVLPTGGGVTHTRMVTDLMVGKSLLGERTGSGDCLPKVSLCLLPGN